MLIIKLLKTFYFTEYDDIREVVCEINKPFLFDNKINTCHAFLHNYQPYDDFSSDIKKKVDIMLDFIKSIWASNDNDQNKFILQWLSNMIRDNKLQ